MKSFMLNFDIA